MPATADSSDGTASTTGDGASSTLALMSSEESSTFAGTSDEDESSAEPGTGGFDTCDEPSLPEITGPVYEGDVFVLTAADMEAIEEYAEITGSLIVGTSFVGAFDLPNLRRVGGDVYVEGVITNAGNLVDSQVTQIRLPALVSIDGTLWIYLNTSLETLDLRRVEQIGNRFWVYRNVALWDLRLDALRSFGGDAQVQGNPRIPRCYTEMLAAQLPGETGAIVGGTETDCSCEETCDRVVVVCAGR